MSGLRHYLSRFRLNNQLAKDAVILLRAIFEVNRVN
jgi:hypothetical protein